MNEPRDNGTGGDRWKNSVRHIALTDVGMRRAINQDSMGVFRAESKESWERFGHLFIVADGMGAHAAGELASQLAVELIPQNYRKTSQAAPAESLHKAISDANAEIFRRGQANIEFRSMGTTCSVLSLLPEGAVVAHVGDSRVYQLHGDQLYQLTFDHSLVWEMQAAGEVTDETARSGVIPKNVITRSLGPNANVEIDLEGPFPIQKGDRYLLCSDGLSGQVTDEEIGALMRVLPPAEAAQIFIDLSNLRGGPDNITAIVVEATDDMILSNGGGMVVRRSGQPKSFSPALGIVSGVCLALAGVFWYLTLPPIAIVALVLGIIALLTGFVQVFWPNTSGSEQGSRYGNGPYRQYKAAPSQTLFEHLAGTMKSLREAAEERKWKIDWTDLDKRFGDACKSADKSDYDTAVASQARVIVDLMKQIKRQRDGNASDSAVDL
ncbi:MAG: PP2C family protein-serine/threonine phosphatase [Aureliella sp.]